jgi:hypothetical protein
MAIHGLSTLVLRPKSRNRSDCSSWELGFAKRAATGNWLRQFLPLIRYADG